MRKGFFLSLPSLSVQRMLTPPVARIAEHYDILYYNTAAFEPRGDYPFRFRAYPLYRNGYDPDCMDGNPSLFEFGEILGDTAASLIDFLLEEIERERPDFILHSHLAVWGKLLARHCGLPAISLFSTFFPHKAIMLPRYRQQSARPSGDLSGVQEAFGFYRKMQGLYRRLGLHERLDIWDVLMNEEGLNISFIHEALQPDREVLGPEFVFSGYSVPSPRGRPAGETVYLSLGSMINNETDFYLLCLRALKEIPVRCLFSVGRKIDIGALGVIPSNIEVTPFVDQVAVLQDSALFLTRGGMASVHEAIYSQTPLLAIPATPEQQVTAGRVQQLGIGTFLTPGELTEERLRTAVLDALQNTERIRENIRMLQQESAGIPGKANVLTIIDQYLKDELDKN